MSNIVESSTSPVYSYLSLWTTITIFSQVYSLRSLWDTITTPFLLQSPENFTLLTGTVSGRIKQLLEAVCTELELHHVRLLA